MVSVLVEPGYDHTHWAQMYLTGIREEAHRYNIDVETISQEQNISKAIIVLGSSTPWLNACLARFDDCSISYVLAGAPPPGKLCSFSMPDYEKAIMLFSHIVRGKGGRKPALFASHPASAADTQKREAFERICIGGLITENQGDLLLSAHMLSRSIDEIEAVLCVNDVSAMILRRILLRYKQKPPIYTFGDQYLPDNELITVFKMDLIQAGRQALHIVRQLEKQPTFRQCTWIPCESMKLQSAKDKMTTKDDSAAITAMNFYQDPQVPEVFRLKALLSSMDSLDFDILSELLLCKRYVDISDTLHTTDSTIKYRLKRMMHNANVSSRDELLHSIKYLFSSSGF